MKFKLIALATLLCGATAFAASFSGQRPDARITGDYVETRTASVFCGACHYNGELVTTGHDALMAWKFDGGLYKGVSLKGITAMAAITCEENLTVNNNHKSQIVIDSSATSQQAAAIAALLQEKCGDELGQVVQISRAPVSFTHHAGGYAVNSEGFATINVANRIDNSCCVSPGLVWYMPLSPIADRRVGYTESVSFTGSITAPWSRGGEDSAFYGAIAF